MTKTYNPLSISILATGDEIIHGDILNTNSQEISKVLFQEGMQVQNHMVAPDDKAEISRSILYLLKHHQVLIITGGLGPTSDDITRYALAEALDRDLVFDESSWQNICKRLAHFGYKEPPASNRRQAEFPKGSIVINNPNGTAAGCMIQIAEQTIFMLPGPPDECLPIFQTTVLPFLQLNNFATPAFHRKWLLFGVSEAKIAEELDAISQPFKCRTGYRLSFPYLEFKIHATEKEDFTALSKLINKAVKPYIIGDGTKIASEMLKQKLSKINSVIGICDSATGGLLESVLRNPATCLRILFSDRFDAIPNKIPAIKIMGLSEYWQQRTAQSHTSIQLQFKCQEIFESETFNLPFRNKKVRIHAVELICLHIYNYLLKVLKE